MSEAVDAAVRGVHAFGVAWVTRYHRLSVQVLAPLPDEPSLIVANHGFGGLIDVNIFATYAALEAAGIDRPIRAMTHQLAWTLKVGPLLESFGAVPASRVAAQQAVAEGCHVLVFPGGDVDAGRPWNRRNNVDFDGRTGFARLAIELGLPVVPVATAGAGETLLVLSSGRRLARRLPAALRMKAAPISVSLPWGLSIGVTGLAPYLPLPAKMTSQVLPAVRHEEGEPVAAYAERIQGLLQASIDRMTDGRIPFLG